MIQLQQFFKGLTLFQLISLVLSFLISIFLFKVLLVTFSEFELFGGSYENSLLAVQERYVGGYLYEKIPDFFFRKTYYSLIQSHLGIVKALLVFLVSSFVLIQVVFLRVLFKDKGANRVLFPYKKQYLLTLLFVGGLHGIMYYFLPLHVDELFDYLEFSRQSFVMRQSYIFTDYLGWVNNHILYAHCTAFFNGFIPDPKFSIRITSILMSFALVTYVCFNFNSKYSLLINVVLLGSFWLLIYSNQGRSYYSYAVLYFISVIELYKYYLDKKLSRLIIIEMLLMIGLMFNKTFIIPFLGVNLLAYVFSFQEKIHFRYLILLNVKTIVGLILFYSPALLLNGIHSIFVQIPHANGSFRGMFPVFFENLSLITSFNSMSYLGLLIYGGVIVLMFKYLSQFSKYLILTFSVQFTLFVMFIVVSQTFLPCRSQLYLHITFLVSTLFVLVDLLSRNNRCEMIMSGLITLFLCYNVYLFSYSWTTRLHQFVLDRELYKSILIHTQKIKKLNVKTIHIAERNVFYYYYLRTYLNEDVKYVKSPTKADLIITEIPQKEFLFHDNIGQVYIVLNGVTFHNTEKLLK